MPFKFEIPDGQVEEQGDRKVKVTVKDPSGEKTVEVWRGYRLWDAMLDADADFWRLCGGDGVCGTCRVEVRSGADSLSPKTMLEKRTDDFKGAGRIVGSLLGLFWAAHGIFKRSPNWRLACQSYVLEDVEVEWRENSVQQAPKKLRRLLPGGSDKNSLSEASTT